MKALIIGGGIGGLTAAIALRRVGVDVCVFEQSPELREAVAGLKLWSNATRILDRLGISSKLRHCSATLGAGEIRNSSGKLLTRIPFEPLSRDGGNSVLGIHRADLLRLLAEQLPTECIFTSHRLDSFSQDPNFVTAKFANGNKIDGDFLVGADGIHTVVRTQILGDPPRYCGYLGWRGIGSMDAAGIDPHLSVWSYGRGAQFGLIPIDSSRVFWFATTTLPESEIERLGPPKEELLRRFSEWSRPIPEFLDSLNPDSVLVTPIYDRHPAATWGRGRVTMLGDAAHATSPTLGQGACLAIESAFALAKHIEAAGHAIPALRSYETERQTRTERIIRLSRQIGAAIQWKQPLACWLRDQLIWATPSRLHLTVLRSIISTGLIPLEPKCA